MNRSEFRETRPSSKSDENDIVSATAAARDRIVNKLEDADGEALFDQLCASAAKLQREIDDLKLAVKSARLDRASLTPIRGEDLQSLVGSLHKLLYENISLAGSVLVALTGPVKLTQSEPLPGKRRPQWTAEFKMNHAKVFVEIARQLICPSTATWEFLSRRSWTMGEPRSVTIRSIGNAERIAKTVADMLAAGSTRNMAAIALQVDVETVNVAAAWWAAGEGCHLPSKDFKFRRELSASKVENIAPDCSTDD